MASGKGPVATEGPLIASQPSVLAPVDAVAASDPSRKSLKRVRETTPTSPPVSSTIGDLSPSKIARLVGYTRSPIVPLTGAAALEDERRQREEELRQNPPGTSENPSHKVLEAMSAVVEISRLEDAPPPPPAEATARPNLPPVIIPTTNVTLASVDDTSPHSAATPGSLESAAGQVVHSPVPMDIDSHNDRLYPPQPDAQMEDKTATSLSYPGLLPTVAMGTPTTPQRGMSLPLANPQDPDSARPSSGKKHKCPYCKTEFTRHHNLKSHLLTHSQEKPYVCQTCDMRFRRLHDLKRHSKLHTGEKPHVCPKCQRKFARGDALARHSKGAGGCAGRRSSMGSFAGEDDYDGPSGMEDDSVMSGVVYDASIEGADLTEEERRRLSLPTVRASHVGGQPVPEGFAAHPSTYPPSGTRAPGSGGLYPPNVDRGASSSNTSPSVPNSHTPHTSISSMPMSAGGSLYAQSAMTESPKPLSPVGTRQRSPSLTNQSQQLRQADLTAPPHGKAPSDPGYLAWLSNYPPADGKSGEGSANANATEAAAASAKQQAAGQTRPAAPLSHSANGLGDAANNLFAAGEQGMWAYLQHLDEKVKSLTAEVDAGKRTEAQLMDKVSATERQVSNLTAEVEQLRKLVAPPTEVPELQE